MPFGFESTLFAWEHKPQHPSTMRFQQPQQKLQHCCQHDAALKLAKSVEQRLHARQSTVHSTALRRCHVPTCHVSCLQPKSMHFPGTVAANLQYACTAGGNGPVERSQSLLLWTAKVHSLNSRRGRTCCAWRGKRTQLEWQTFALR